MTPAERAERRTYLLTTKYTDDIREWTNRGSVEIHHDDKTGQLFVVLVTPHAHAPQRPADWKELQPAPELATDEQAGAAALERFNRCAAIDAASRAGIRHVTDTLAILERLPNGGKTRAGLADATEALIKAADKLREMGSDAGDENRAAGTLAQKVVDEANKAAGRNW